ncbi:MAG: ATP-binding cassette domain-containing protein [Thermodesulfovibrionales bacterium]|nr:ATP-binding cassette domain-containing protein [Thermodesulfovibrionales bacterium]
MLNLENIEKQYEDGTRAVRNLTLDVKEGETLVLLGSSGCGKTTLLKMINRLIEPTSGNISIKGTGILEQDPIEVRRSIGYVIQGVGLFPHMTIEENVSVVLSLLGESERARRSRAVEVLEVVGLDPQQFLYRYPDELSGGQQQRVGVARALASKPSIMLMDEPFGALDAVNRDMLQQELLRLKDKLEKTIVFVTHDIFEAFTLADRIAVLHEGRLQQIGTKDEILAAPATEFVEELLASPRKQLEKFRGAF